MDHFEYRNGEYYAEDVPLSSVAASVGTPCYVYSRATLEHHFRVFDSAFGAYPHLVCYAVKANSNLGVLNVLARLGSGFDIVSVGELERVLRAGGDPGRVLFSGVGKAEHEIHRALEVGVRCINVESLGELHRVNQIAATMGVIAPIAIRINPDVDAKTHPYIATGLRENKFGIPVDDALDAYRTAASLAHLSVSGVACHIGSQLTDVSPFVDALQKVLDFVEALKHSDIVVDHLDLGGGLGIRYRDEDPPVPAEYTAALRACLNERGCELPVMIEPGRAIAGNAGVLLTRVEYLKHGSDRNFAIVDAAMNDLLRPALYQAWQEILPVSDARDKDTKTYDVVGPVCESADFLGKDRVLGVDVGDLLAVRSCGAYAQVMSSNYNSRPRPAEVIVDGGKFTVVRHRETLAQLMAGESLIDGVDAT